jgi:hypothetical protein
VTIWVVRHGDDLHGRSAYGRTSTWFRGTQDRDEGHINAGGNDKDVLFIEADDNVTRSTRGPATWGAHVTDEEYNAAQASSAGG